MSAPIACTLSGPDLQVRLAAIAALAKRALIGYEQAGSTLHLRYALDAADELDFLVAQERLCCAFLTFELARQADAVHLDIHAPAQVAEFVEILLAHFIGKTAAPTVSTVATCVCQSSG